MQRAAVIVTSEVAVGDIWNRKISASNIPDRSRKFFLHARRPRRIAEFVHLFGHGTGSPPGVRLMKRLGMPVSDDAVLRHLKRQVACVSPGRCSDGGIDDWSWRRARLRDRCCSTLAARGSRCSQDSPDRRDGRWLGHDPEVDLVGRDRCGLYAQGAREGAPQARQVADRFHLLQNLRETIGTRLSRADRSTGRALLRIQLMKTS